MVPEPNGTEKTEDRLSVTLAALADPTRRAMLARLATGDASVAELARPFAMTPRAVSKHLQVLERAGLVTRGRDAQRRPSRIDAAPLREVAGWIGSYRRLWDKRFDQIDTIIANARKETP